MSTSDALGDRGEAILYTILTTFHGSKPLFRPVFLGAKWAVADFAVELLGQPGAFFLIQVKTTEQGMNTKKRLKVSVTKERYNALASTAVPTYIVGVDNPAETAYISAALQPRKAKLSSLTTRYSLRESLVRQRLFDEVQAFWQTVSATAVWMTSVFQDE